MHLRVWRLFAAAESVPNSSLVGTGDDRISTRRANDAIARSAQMRSRAFVAIRRVLRRDGHSVVQRPGHTFPVEPVRPINSLRQVARVGGKAQSAAVAKDQFAGRVTRTKVSRVQFGGLISVNRPSEVGFSVELDGADSAPRYR